VYPGGPVFNFLGVVESESATYEFQEKEVKHGRLAMVAAVGLFAQVRSHPALCCTLQPMSQRMR
jgi:hypothetical protein